MITGSPLVPLHISPEGTTIRHHDDPGSAQVRTLTARRVLALVVAVCSGWVAYAVYGQAVKGNDLEAQARRLTAQNSVLRAHIEDVQGQIAAAHDPAWLEQQARGNGYVKPGERIYVVVSPGTAAPAKGGGVNAAPPVYVPPGSTPAPPSASAGPTPSPTPLVFVLPGPGH